MGVLSPQDGCPNNTRCWLPGGVRCRAERTQPEAAYFGTENGQRTGYIFFDLTDLGLIPVLTEPLFQELQSTVEFIPVMNVEDLQRGLAQAAQG